MLFYFKTSVLVVFNVFELMMNFCFLIDSLFTKIFDSFNNVKDLFIVLFSLVRINMNQMTSFNVFFLRVINQNTMIYINLKQRSQFVKILDVLYFLSW